MKKLLFLLLAAVLSLTQLSAQTTPIVVGTGTSTNWNGPIPGNYGNHRSIQLFTASELGSVGGTIDSIGLDIGVVDAGSGRTLRIYMKEVADTTVASQQIINNLTQDAVLVYSSTGFECTANAWNDIALQTPFAYSGANSLCIIFEGEGCTTSGGCSVNTKYTPGAGKAWTKCWDASAPSMTTPISNTNAYRANMRFYMSPLGDDYCHAPTNVTLSNITSDGVDISWESNASSTTFALEYKLATDEDWTLESNSISGNAYTLSGLAAYADYDVKIYAVCADGTSVVQTKRFRTMPDASLFLTIPYEQNFDDATAAADNWRFENGTNAWYIGTAVNNTSDDDGNLTEGGALYISNDGGTSNRYTVNVATVSFAYAFVNLEEGNSYGLTFDWKCGGETNLYDYLRVYLVPVDVDLVAGTLPNSNYAISDGLWKSGAWQRAGVEIPASYTGNSWKLVFAWRNDGSGGDTIGAAIDNLNIITLPCGSVDSVVVTMSEESGLVASLEMLDQNSNAEYLVEYRAEGVEDWSSITSASPVELSDVMYSMTYEYRVRAICNSSDSSMVFKTGSFTTPCGSISAFPYVQSFEQIFRSADTTIGTNTAPYCWFNINGGASSYYFYRSSAYSASGDASLYYYGPSSNYVTASDWIITPVFDLTGGERVNFKVKSTSTSTSSPNLVIKLYALDVSESDIATTADTSLFVYVDSITHDYTSTEFEDYEISLGAYTAATRLAIVINQPCRSFYLDDFQISEMPSCPDVYGVSVVPTSSTSVSVSFNTANGTDAGWVIAYGTVGEGETFDPETATTMSVTQAEDVPVTIDGLTTGETYWFAVKQDCGGNYTVPMSCHIPIVNEMPYEQNFDDATGATEWIFVERTSASSPSASKWFVGTATNNTTDDTGTPTAGGAMYISKDNGVSNQYDIANAGNFYAYALFNFDGAPAYTLSFDWKAGGEGAYDYLTAYLVPIGVEIPTSIISSVPTLDDYLIVEESNLTAGQWESENMLLLGEDYNGVYQLIFRWRNDGSLTTDSTGVAIDNIRLVALDCGPVSSVTATAEAAAVGAENVTVNVDITDNNDGVTYIVSYKASSESTWTDVSGITEADFPYALSLDFGTSYQIKVAAVCSDGDTTDFVYAPTVVTPCNTLALPWSETFDVTPFTAANCWERKSGLLSTSGTTQTSSLSSTTMGWGYQNTRSIGGEVSGRVKVNIYGTDVKHWLMTPAIDLGDGSTTYQFAFDVALTKWNSGDAPTTTSADDKFAVLVSTDGGTSWNIENAIVFADGDQDTLHNFSDLTNSFRRVILKLEDSEGTPMSGVVRFAFYGESTVSGGDNDCYIDNLEISEWSSCQAPYNVSVSDITDNSAVVSFAAMDPTASFEYSLVEGADADITTGTPEAVTGNLSETLSSLSPATTYQIAVRAVCDGGENSAWSAPATFKTLATPASIPYSIDFENSEDNNGWNFVSNGTNNKWAIGTATFAGEEATGTSAYVSNDNGVSYAATVSSTSTYAVMFKDFDFGEDATTVYDLSFDYKVQGRLSGSSVYSGLLVFVLDPVPIATDDFPEQNENALLYGATEWTHESIELAGYTGIKRLAFVTWGYTQASETTVPAAIDNISLQVSACATPQEVTVSNITTNSVDVSWTGTADSYVISYMDLTTSEITDVPAAASPFTLTGLEVANSYAVAVRGVCGGDTSNYSVEVLFVTPMESEAVPYTCDFEAAGNNGWLIKNGACTNQWHVGTPSGAASASLYISGDGGTTAGYTIANAISVVVAEKLFETGTSDSLTISFDLTIGGESSYDYLKVFWTPADTNYEASTNASVYYAASAYAPNVIMGNTSSSKYVNKLTGTQTMSATVANVPNSLRKLVFIWRNDNSMGDQPGAIIDNLSITEGGDSPSEPCDAPTALTVSNITETTAEVSWNGSASSYEVRLNGGAAETVTTTSKTLSGLTAGTAYTVEVRAVCESSNSAWVSTNFTTANAEVIAPSVATLAATDITQDGATLHGTVTAGSETIDAQGFEYKAQGEAEWENMAASGESMSAELSGLTAATTYEYRAYARTASGNHYGDIMSFTTQQSSSLAEATSRAITAVIYPNPAKDKAVLKMSGITAEATLIISDMQGRILATETIAAGSKRYELNTSNYASGVYYIRIVAGNTVNTQKLIVE